MKHPSVDLETILQKNHEYAAQYQRNALLQWLDHPALDQPEARTRLMDCIQLFSNHFQKMVMLRQVLTDNQPFLKVARLHLEEEYGHDRLLMAERANREPIWDPILEATACWFSWKMLTLDNTEKALLVHLVLEVSANLFCSKANARLQKYGETDYFKEHAEADQHHEKMGTELLVDLSEKQYQRLLEVQQQGWSMMDAASKQMATLATMQ